MASQPKLSQIGPYQIIEELGRGAMGVVFRGFDPGISRPVAVKVIRPQHFNSADQAEARMRFTREANAAGRLSHPNIVTIYQMGEDRGYQYMAMEYVEGVALTKLMTPGVPMEAQKAIEIVRQVSDALDHAHQQEVVHRDVKPPNILVRPDGRIKIADFGIARIASQTLTQQGMTLGTPAYMAPEQIQGIKVDGKADQFSLAVLAYQLLAGEKPFEASSEQALILAIVSDAPKPIHTANPAMPEAASKVFERALAKEPAARYPTCAEFSTALVESLKPAPKPVIAEPVIVEPVVTKRRAAFPSTLVVVGLAVVIAVLFAYMFLHGQPAQTPTTSPGSRPRTVPQASVPAAQPPPQTAGKGEKSPLSPEDLQRLKIRRLEARRTKTATELDAAQKELDALRQSTDTPEPDLQNASARVDKLRKSLEEIDDNLATLKSAR